MEKQPVNLANAQRIAHTLNHFDALLEALEGFVDHQEWRLTISGCHGTWEPTYQKAIEALKAAQTVEVGQ